MRYVFKNRETGDIFFNVNFTLLWGEELRKALEKDGHESDEEQAVNVTQANANAKTAVKDDSEPEHEVQRHESQATSPGQKTADAVSNDLPPLNAPRPFQLHPGDYNATAQGVASSTKTDSSTDSTSMRLHPGDHCAAAGSMSKTHETSVDEIDKLLQSTSTSQQTGGRFLDDVD